MQPKQIAVVICLILMMALNAVSATTLYVATNGNNTWSGSLSVPSQDGSDGPLATLVGARDKIRQLKTAGQQGPFDVLVRGGTYYESPTLTLNSTLDSGAADKLITYKAYPGEIPILSGGKRLSQPTLIEGGRYSVFIPEATDRKWKFRQLFIDDKRYTLAKSPNTGYFYVQGIPPTPPSPYYGEPYWYCHNFICKPGDLKNWSTLSAGDISIRVYHLWEMCTVLLTSVNESANTAFSETHMLWGYNPNETISAGGISKRYLIENAPDSLDCPGEWYLDRVTGVLTIIPFASENLAEKALIVPVTKNAIKVTGNADANVFIQYVQFQGLTFRHFAEPILNGGMNGGWRTSQAASGIDSCVDITAGRNLTFSQCEISHIGTHAIEFKRGCTNNTVQQCHLYDLGGGGIYIGERVATSAGYSPGTYGQTSNNVINNNFIHDGGIIHQSGMGIVIGQSSDNAISHNEISYFNQCGIQIGWNWDTSSTWHKNNRIEYNHIHDIGQNVSSDLAGIYTVGENLNTLIANNKIHDVYCWVEANGKGLYPDENTSGVTFEKNLIYSVGAFGLGINYCRDITVRNNIFASNYGKAPFMFGHSASARITRNIFYYDYGNPYSDNYDKIQTSWFVECNNNLYWRIDSRPVLFQKPTTNGSAVTDRITFSQWKSQTGFDAQSVVADPLFKDPENGDFSFRSTANASKIGFVSVDWSQSGLTGDSGWTSLPRQYDKKARYAVYDEKWLDYKFAADGLCDSFETSMPSATPKNAAVFDTLKNGTVNAVVEITDVRAYQGSQSLKVESDGGHMPSLEYDTYDPILYSGKGRVTCQIFKEPGASAAIDFYSDNAGSMNRFANVDIYPTGLTSSAFGNPLVVVPDNTWVQVDIDFSVGDAAQTTYGLRLSAGGSTLYSGTITNPNALPHNLEKIKIRSFTDNSVFFIDNLGVKKHTVSGGDYNSNRFIDFNDFSLFSGAFQYLQDISYFDREAITYVRINDLYEIIENWLFYDPDKLMESWQFDLPPGSSQTLLTGSNGLDAVLTGQTNWQGDGFYFDGSSYFTVSKDDPAYAINLSGDFIIKTKIKTTQSSTVTLWSKLNTTWEPGAKQLFIQDGYPIFDCGWIATVPAVHRVNDGSWHEVKVVYEKTNNLISIYIDNIQSACQQPSQNMWAANDNFSFCIGAQTLLPGGGRAAPFVGVIQELVVLY